ncbi:MAG: PH domain-containing protein [Phycisphaerae bacterium]
MTVSTLQPRSRRRRRVMAQAEGGSGGTAVVSPLAEVVPSHLLDGGEVVHFAMKPSMWFIPLVSCRWLAFGALLVMGANLGWLSPYQWHLYQAAILLCGIRLAWATLQWVSRLYVLTNRRIMRLRGVYTVELFECPLGKIQNTVLTMAPWERMARIGTITFQTAGGGSASWHMIARPLEVHQRVRDAIDRTKNRGSNGL